MMDDITCHDIVEQWLIGCIRQDATMLQLFKLFHIVHKINLQKLNIPYVPYETKIYLHSFSEMR